MNKTNKIHDAEVQLGNREHYQQLEAPMVKTTQQKVNNVILIGANTLMTWRENGFHKPPVRLGCPFSTHLQKSTDLNRSVDRLYISVCDGPTERISSFIDILLQPIAQNQQSCIKDTTDFINFIEKTKIGQDAILVSMDVTSLYTNIPQEEGTEIVCKAYELFHNNDPPIPTHYLRKMLGLILTENSFEFNGNNYLQTHGLQLAQKQQCVLQISTWQRLKQPHPTK